MMQGVEVHEDGRVMRIKPIKFAQLSDTHLMAHSRCRCWWMADDPAAQLKRAIEQLEAIPDLDFVVFTGDLVDQADPESFAQFAEIVQQISVPFYLSVGNHDIDTTRSNGRWDRAQFLNWCHDLFPFTPAPTDRCDYSLSPAPGIRLIALDACLGRFPKPQGRLTPLQLDWLQAELQAHAQEWVIILIHQPPLAPVFFRKYRVKPEQATAFHQLLTDHGHVAAVLSGHLHVPQVYSRAEIPYLVAPALVGPVSAFRVFELGQIPSSANLGWSQGILRYHWHRVPTSLEQPDPLWRGWVMGRAMDRHGETILPVPTRWQHAHLSVVGSL